jgi:hypothetical protein
MKKKSTLLLFTIAISTCNLFAQTTHTIKIQLDTKKFPNPNCSLNTPCDGTPTPLTEIYMHSGVCWQSQDGTPDSTYCAGAITPLNSPVWQSVVGNWGANPLADGVGQMVYEGNGIFTKEFVVEQYYSSPDVSTATEPNSGVTSQPMPSGKTAYTMGLVFRDPTGQYTGRDGSCSDIFINKLHRAVPYVISGSSLDPWPDGPVSFIYGLTSVETNELFYEKNIAPNPLTGDLANINFFVRNHQKDFEINVYDAVGNLVKTVYRGELPAGKQTAHWDATNNEGAKVANGMYYFSMRSGNNLVSDKIIVNR